MRMDTPQKEELVPVVDTVSETRHEPHEHARSRVIWGMVAFFVVLAGVLVWERWGTDIKQACLGDNGACVVEGFEQTEGGVVFESPQGF